MSFKFVPPIKLVFYGDIASGKEHIKFARNQLAILERQMSFQKINEGRRVVAPYNGVTVECLSSFSHHEVRIFVNVPPRHILIPALPAQAMINRKLLEYILYEVMSLAYNWTWDAGLIPDPPEFTVEEYATRVIESNCFMGSVSKDGFELNNPVAIPTITEFLTPYRVTDLAQVRYKAATGKVSLIMADYCIQAYNDSRYTSVSVLGEGGFPSIVFDISLNLGDYDDETAILGMDCVVEVDASLSIDFQKLYKIVVIRGEAGDAKYAIINYEIYVIDTETNTWVADKSGQIYAPGDIYATPLLFIRRRIYVNREGFIGPFSYENPAPEMYYEINEPTPKGPFEGTIVRRVKGSYKNVCQRYLYSLDSDTFTETDDQAYTAKIVNINTYDYEIIKSDDGEYSWDETYSYNYLAPFVTLSSTILSGVDGLNVEFDGFTGGGMHGYTYMSTYYGPRNSRRVTTQSYGTYLVQGGYYLFPSRRTLLIWPGASYYEEIEDYDHEPGDGTYEPFMDCPSAPYHILSYAHVGGCPPGTDQYEYIGSIESDYEYGSYATLTFSYKRFDGPTLAYPTIDTVRGVVEAKNAFICCDNKLKAVFYGQHVRSTVANQEASVIQVHMRHDYPIDEKTYSEWYVKFQSASVGTFDVTNVILAKYGNALLTDITDPELEPPPPNENLAPWIKDPIEYTPLEPFFGVIFYGSTITKQED